MTVIDNKPIQRIKFICQITRKENNLIAMHTFLLQKMTKQQLPALTVFEKKT